MNYYFETYVQAKVYGNIEAISEEDAREKINERLRIYPKLVEDNGSETEYDDIDWEIHEECHGHVCNFYGGGINVEAEK